MSKFICKAFNNARSAIRNSYLIRIQPYSTSLQSINNSRNPHSFTASYLINSCGFPPEKALLTSRYIKFGAPEKPDSVLAFLRSQGLTQTQIMRTVRGCPSVLLYNPEKMFLPKVQFFRSKGMSNVDIAKLLIGTPSLFTRSLERQIIPSFEYFTNFLLSEEKAISAIRRFGMILCYDANKLFTPIIESLKEVGVPNKHITAYFARHPGMFLASSKKFKDILEGVQRMGFNPSQMMFLVAILAVRSMTKSNWEKKLEVYKKWGWSKEDTLVAFGKFPQCMMLSEDKITRTMDYLVNNMGQVSSSIWRRPEVIGLSLERRIIPRCALYEVLLSKGLIKISDRSLFTMLRFTEKRFLELLDSHKEEAPELSKLYKEKLALAK